MRKEIDCPNYLAIGPWPFASYQLQWPCDYSQSTDPILQKLLPISISLGCLNTKKKNSETEVQVSAKTLDNPFIQEGGAI